MTVTREFAKKIAAQHIKTMNPLLWDGNGKQPISLDTQICTYEIHSKHGNELDISFDVDDGEWCHYCKLKDKKTGDTIIHLHGYGIDSIENLADTILDICQQES